MYRLHKHHRLSLEVRVNLEAKQNRGKMEKGLYCLNQGNNFLQTTGSRLGWNIVWLTSQSLILAISIDIEHEKYFKFMQSAGTSHFKIVNYKYDDLVLKELTDKKDLYSSSFFCSDAINIMSQFILVLDIVMMASSIFLPRKFSFQGRWKVT